MTVNRSSPQRPATLSEIMALVGEIDGAKAEAILKTGATPAEIEQALILTASDSHDPAVLGRPLQGPVAAVCAILSTELPDDDREH